MVLAGAGEIVRVSSEESSGLPSPTETETDEREKVDLKIVFNKQKLDLTFPLDELVSSLKTEIEKLTGVPVAMQKVMFKGKYRSEGLFVLFILSKKVWRLKFLSVVLFRMD